MKLIKYLLFICLISFFTISCSNDGNGTLNLPEENLKELTIFHFNDPHGRLENFAKIKYIVDQEKELTNVLLVSSGDLFSGNPVVDNFEQKGFPMIDIMNEIGVDISVIGNHEYDYGEAILKNRFQQSNFDWVCANVDMNATGIPEPYEYKAISKNDVKVTFLGLVETNGKDNDIIPSTHPWRVKNLTFKRYQNVIENYAQIKEIEQADLYVVLTHLGESTDSNIATNFPYFDLIIGGHSHTKVNTTVNSIPIFQAGSNLNYLGKIKLIIKNKKIEKLTYDLINLSNFPNYDASIKLAIDEYNEIANLDDVIGYANANHTKPNVGCFYTDALRSEMNVDFSIQNTGGIRNELNQGDITKREIFTIDPFNNGSVTYTMTVAEIKNFLINSKIAIYFNGIEIEQDGNSIIIRKENQILNDNASLTIGLNDYIPAVYDTYFTQTPTYLPNTTAETILNYFEKNTGPIDYSQCSNYFRFQ